MVLQPAQIEWRDDQPYAPAFDDIYYSTQGPDEVRRVFLEPSQILQRAQEQLLVTIVELGFGSGLNFAVCAAAICAQSRARMHFISFEKHPLTPHDWQRAADRYPELRAYRQIDLPLLPGWHRRVLMDGRVTLSVYFGEACDGLADLSAGQKHAVDAWFLDGFAPDKNPQLWDEALIAQLPHLSHGRTTVSTFSAAGRVKRTLEQHGFAVSKVDQQPYKRESIVATYVGESRCDFQPIHEVTVLGAGIAGASLARHVADQGLAVNVFDPKPFGTGIDAAVLHGRLLGDGSVQADWRAASFHYASQYLRQFSGFRATGVRQILGPNLNAEKLERIAQRYHANDSILGHWLAQEGDSLWFPTGGVVDLATLCRDLLDHPNIDLIQSPADGPASTVVCAGGATPTLTDAHWLEITEVYGQLDWIRTAQPLTDTPIVGNGYLVPGAPGEYAVGASYEYAAWDVDDATAHNMKLNAHLLDGASTQWLRRCRGARAIASDRLPVIGAVREGTWVSTAHGSMGTVSAPLAAAMISSEILGWVPPVTRPLIRLVDPQRFVARQARRGPRYGASKISADPRLHEH